MSEWKEGPWPSTWESTAATAKCQTSQLSLLTCPPPITSCLAATSVLCGHLWLYASEVLSDRLRDRWREDLFPAAQRLLIPCSFRLALHLLSYIVYGSCWINKLNHNFILRKDHLWTSNSNVPETKEILNNIWDFNSFSIVKMSIQCKVKRIIDNTCTYISGNTVIEMLYWPSPFDRTTCACA